MNIEKDILFLIESSIKKGNTNIKLFKENLIANLQKNYSNNDLNNIIQKKLFEKNIYFIRHAQAIHNVLEVKYKGDISKYNIYDPELTEKGKNQTKKTIEKLKNENIIFDSIFISPLSRTIQTYILVKDYLNKNAKVYATDFIREVLSFLDKNKGIQLSILKKQLNEYNINSEYMTKEFWWFDLGENKENEREGHTRFNLRLRLFILWLIFRPEKNILIISHSHVFHALQDNGIYNADLIKMNNTILLVKILKLFEDNKVKNNNKSKKKSCNII